MIRPSREVKVAGSRCARVRPTRFVLSRGCDNCSSHTHPPLGGFVSFVPPGRTVDAPFDSSCEAFELPRNQIALLPFWSVLPPPLHHHSTTMPRQSRQATPGPSLQHFSRANLPTRAAPTSNIQNPRSCRQGSFPAASRLRVRALHHSKNLNIPDLQGGIF